MFCSIIFGFWLPIETSQLSLVVWKQTFFSLIYLPLPTNFFPIQKYSFHLYPHLSHSNTLDNDNRAIEVEILFIKFWSSFKKTSVVFFFSWEKPLPLPFQPSFLHFQPGNFVCYFPYQKGSFLQFSYFKVDFVWRGAPIGLLPALAGRQWDATLPPLPQSPNFHGECDELKDSRSKHDNLFGFFHWRFSSWPHLNCHTFHLILNSFVSSILSYPYFPSIQRQCIPFHGVSFLSGQQENFIPPPPILAPLPQLSLSIHLAFWTEVLLAVVVALLAPIHTYSRVDRLIAS